MNGALLNFSNIARDIGSTTPTVQSYFQILEDTLLGFYLEPYHLSIRKRQKESPKFYFFDTGVQRALADLLTLPLVESSYGYGKTFEHFIILELHRRSSYLRNDFKFSFLVTKDDAEIDLIVERPGRTTILVEIKSTTAVREDHIAALRKFLPDFKNSEGVCLSRDRTKQKFGDVTCLPWDEGISMILGG
jgi:predicted AAA+ superfamily ATPase